MSVQSNNSSVSSTFENAARWSASKTLNVALIVFNQYKAQRRVVASTHWLSLVCFPGDLKASGLLLEPRSMPNDVRDNV